MLTGFIGAGRTGCSLGKYLSQKGIPVTGYYDVSKEAAESAAAFTASKSYDSLEALAGESSLVFITTPDSLIQKTWEKLKLYPLEGKIICHCSGALASHVFKGIKDRHAHGCSLHPMLPFGSRLSSYQILEHAFFTIEGSKRAVQTVSDLFTKLGNTVCPISGDCKPKYHAAASILSNQVTAVLDTGYRLLEECGFSRTEAVSATKNLILHNIENILQNDCVQALTGPIERGDLPTVQKHLDCLHTEDKKMYQILGSKLISIARKKHPDQDYSGLLKLLQDI